MKSGSGFFCAKSFVLLSLLVLSFPDRGLGQNQDPSRYGMLRQQQMMTGGIGLTSIDGNPYYLIFLRPELTFGKIGLGLELNLRVGEDGKLRKEDWDETYDYFRIIRYLRYGLKRDPLYARAGALDYARLGHGSVVYLYRNSPSYDLRRIGLELDADFGDFGFESIYSDFGAEPLIGLRSYVRPLQLTEAAAIPILGNMEVGATYAADLHPNADISNSVDALGRTVQRNNGTLSIIGIDIGFPLLSLDILNSTLYADYAKILEYGSGVALGIDLNFSGLGAVTLAAKYERRFNGDQYLPSYFDAFYEKERFVSHNDPAANTILQSKANTLRKTKSSEGYYGELWVSVLGTLNIVGGYYSPVGVRNAGILHLELETGNALPGIYLSGGYDKKNVGSVFKVDNNSILHGQVGYFPYPFLLVSMLYEWTFVEDKDEFGIVRGYKTQKRVEPRVGFMFYF